MNTKEILQKQNARNTLSKKNKNKLLANKDVKSAYDNANKVMKDMTISKSKVDADSNDILCNTFS